MATLGNASTGQSHAGAATDADAAAGRGSTAPAAPFADFSLDRDGSFLLRRQSGDDHASVVGLLTVQGFVGSRPESDEPIAVEGLVGAGYDERGVAVEGFGGRATASAPLSVEGFGDAGARAGNPAKVAGFGDTTAATNRQDEEEEETGQDADSEPTAQADASERSPAETDDEIQMEEYEDKSGTPAPKAAGKLAFTVQLRPFGSQGFHQASMDLLRKMIGNKMR